MNELKDKYNSCVLEHTKLIKQVLEQQKQIAEFGKVLNVLTDALSEIKATVDGDSEQPIKDIIYGCIKEIKELGEI